MNAAAAAPVAPKIVNNFHYLSFFHLSNSSNIFVKVQGMYMSQKLLKFSQFQEMDRKVI